MKQDDRVAIYIRLSDEDRDWDGGGKSESESIANQRNMLIDFIGRTPELAGASVVEFCDDGWSGKNFQRPGVKELLKQAREGKIKCIVVKDISRFGRDYLEVGNYLSRIFPFLGIRFLSVNDHFDSGDKLESDGLETAVKTLIYDLYSRDLSMKIRSARRVRAEKGYYINAHAPFGYIKDPMDRHRLLVDEEAAETVRHIFSMAAAGQSPTEIAKCLNLQGIPTRMEHKQAQGFQLNWQSLHEKNFWTGTAVRYMVRDERYTGKAVYRRRAPVSIGDNIHSQKVEKSDWIVVEGAHPAMIPMEQFAAANEKIRRRSRSQKPKKRQLFYHKLFCGICGHGLRRIPAAEPYYTCVTNRVTEAFPCQERRFSEGALRNLVGLALRCQILGISAESIISQIKLEEKEFAESNRQARKGIDAALGRIMRAKSALYERLVSGSCSRERYLTEKRALCARQKTLEAERIQLEAGARMGEEQAGETAFWIMQELIDRMVGRIEVWPDGRLEITWDYREPNFFSPSQSAGDVHVTGSHTGRPD